MINLLYQIVRTARPRQWLKNLSLFAAPVFTGLLFTGNRLTITIEAFFVFCAIASGVYFLNDIVDAPKDKLHPIKKNRPIPSGKLGVRTAWVILTILWVGAIYYASTFIGTYFTLAIFAYLLIQVAYSFYFRNVIILESLIVSSGFIIRVFAGGFASESSVSSWLILTTIGVSLLIAFGKRRSEKTLLNKHLKSEDIDTRKTLRHYPDTLLNSMISTSASFSIISYALFTFQTSPQPLDEAISTLLPSTLRNPKLMMLTIPIVIYGVARYLYVIYEKEEGESPERVLLKDRPLLAAVILWGMLVMTIIYVLPML